MYLPSIADKKRRIEFDHLPHPLKGANEVVCRQQPAKGVQIKKALLTLLYWHELNSPCPLLLPIIVLNFPLLIASRPSPVGNDGYVLALPHDWPGSCKYWVINKHRTSLKTLWGWWGWQKPESIKWFLSPELEMSSFPRTRSRSPEFLEINPSWLVGQKCPDMRIGFKQLIL